MNNFKMKIEYDGSRYKGWQRLKDNPNTIQQKIEDVLTKMTGKEIKIIGSGRTDMGVHAKAQVANVHINGEYTPKEIKDYCNRYLPEDIGIVEVIKESERFHARYNAKSKTYAYYIWNSKDSRVFDRKYIYKLEDRLDIKKMQEAAKLFVGKHDFKGFTAMKSKKKSTERTIFSIDITTDGPMIKIAYKGDGFLHKMIRILTGTLIEIGLSKMDISDIEDIFNKGVRGDAGITVPSMGLFLEEVVY